MARSVGVVAVLVLCSVVMGGEKAKFTGGQRIDYVVVPGCPLELMAKKSSVSDPKNASAWHRALIGPTDEDYRAEATGAAPGDVIFTVASKNVAGKTIVAREFLWEALNAFDEKIGERTYSYAKPMSPGQAKADYDSGAPLSDDIAYYRLSVKRVKFADGTMWPEPNPATSTPAP